MNKCKWYCYHLSLLLSLCSLSSRTSRGVVHPCCLWLLSSHSSWTHCNQGSDLFCPTEMLLSCSLTTCTLQIQWLFLSVSVWTYQHRLSWWITPFSLKLFLNLTSGNPVLSWVSSYFSGHTFSFFIAESPAFCPFKFGVPQGSTLDHLLNFTFTWYLGCPIHSHEIKYYLYASNSQISISSLDLILQTLGLHMHLSAQEIYLCS